MQIDRTRRASARAAWLLGLLLSAASALHAAPVELASSPTSLFSSAERMISYRHQDHMWQTSDGATHVLINRGARDDGSSLTLHSSFDGGATWLSPMASLASTDATATSDGYIENDNLYVTYSGQTGDIRFAQLRYDSASKTWAVLHQQTVFASAGAIAMTPAMVADAMGRLWLSFTHQDTTTGNYSIRLMYRTSEADAWTDTGYIFGDIDNVSNERCGRPIATANGVGMVYTVHDKVYWAQRNNGWPVTALWQRSLIYTSQSDDADPYGSHFSVVADAQNNLHMASVDGGRLIYSRRMSGEQAWTTRVMTRDAKTNYVQALVAMDNLVVIANHLTVLRVFQSADGGDSFANTHTLTHPAPTDGISYDRPRAEAPSRSSGPIPVLQQYLHGRVQRALSFSVPVVR